MEQEVTVRTGVSPRLVRLEAWRGVGGAAGGLAVANVDHAAVVEVSAARMVPLDDIVVPMERGELKVLSGVEQAAIVLAQPLAGSTELRAITLTPEALEVGHTLGACLTVELVQDAVRSDRREIRAIRGDERRVGKECRSRWSPDD